MIVTLIETYRIFNMTLPDKVKGRFWITDVDSFGNDRKLISVEADEESWVLKGSDSAVICDTHNRIADDTVLEDNVFYNVRILEENEENADRVLDIQKYVNRQYESCSKKKFMKVLETLVHAMGNDEGFIGDMYACNKKARNYYLDEMIQSFNFVFDEMCHGTGSAANCDFDVEE